MELILLSYVIFCLCIYFYVNEIRNKIKLNRFSKLFSKFDKTEFNIKNINESIDYINNVFKNNKLQDVDEFIFMLLSFHVKTNLNPQLIFLCDEYCDLNGKYKNDIIKIVEKYGY